MEIGVVEFSRAGEFTERTSQGIDSQIFHSLFFYGLQILFFLASDLRLSSDSSRIKRKTTFQLQLYLRPQRVTHIQSYL